MEANKSAPNHCAFQRLHAHKATPTMSDQTIIPEQFHQIPLKVIPCLHITFHSEIVHIKEARCHFTVTLK